MSMRFWNARLLFWWRCCFSHQNRFMQVIFPEFVHFFFFVSYCFSDTYGSHQFDLYEVYMKNVVIDGLSFYNNNNRLLLFCFSSHFCQKPENRFMMLRSVAKHWKIYYRFEFPIQKIDWKQICHSTHVWSIVFDTPHHATPCDCSKR